MKLSRGQKLCKSCNQINGARSHVCKHCQVQFISSSTGAKLKTKSKKIKKYETIANWKDLHKGDIIKVIGRSGNYYVNDMGEKTYLSDPGNYTVQRTDYNGLVVYSNFGGFGYIYMGKEKQSDLIDNLYRSPHNIVKVNLPLHPVNDNHARRE